jgi:uracil-DNA glycosylase
MPSSARSTHAKTKLDVLLEEVRACRHCAEHFESHDPRPVLRAHPSARVMLIGQAPGRKVHATGIPWNDPSGDHLRNWLDVDRDVFYDESKFAIVPMGFCYPGHGPSGDLPPRPECAPLWHDRLRALLPNLELTVLIGTYAHRHYLGDRAHRKVTDTVANFRDYLPEYVVTPHPSPRNRLWMKNNPAFERDVLPELRARVHELIA